MKFLYILLSFCCLPYFTFSQISGIVQDEKNEKLPYVNIYVENTSTGTTTNINGEYSLKLEPGSYTLVYQFIGYKTHKESITITGKEINKNVTLVDESYAMPEVVISANAEDPAYAIIRKAQDRRKYFRDLMQNYECDAYVRGFNKMLSAPEKIMGIEVGDMDGALDSTRQGVIYLSESVSKLYAYKGDRKEVMYSSKISGNDQGYSFNSAKEMEFNFYANMIDLESKKIISPIGSAAMTYYKFKLEGAKYDDNGQLVNKIKVTPKNEYGPAFYGHIYINEDIWNINSLELGLTKKSLGQEFVDSLTFKQTFIPVTKEHWMPFSNIIKFRLGAFGFDVGGNFACVYSNYNVDDFDKSVFNREVFKVEEDANQRSEMYWDSIRPIPLTKEEGIDYIRKDSIRLVRESPEYLDSVDRVNNKFKIMNLIGGYSNQNSQKRSNWGITTPLENLNVNTIQGWHGGFGFNYRKTYNKNRTKRLQFRANVNYGLSEKIWRPTAAIHYRANRTNNLNFSLSGGRTVTQVNRTNPISEKLNTIITLIERRNFLKAFDRTYATFALGRNLGSVFGLRTSLTYENRKPLVNNYDGSLFNKESRNFTENIPDFEEHDALIFKASLRIKIGEELWSYPDRTFRVGSSWPTLWLHFRKTLKSGRNYAEFSLLDATLNKRYAVGLWGDFNFHVHAGIFFDEPDYFIDFQHFNGNQTHIGNPSRYWNRFLIMPYYDLSASREFVELHLQHNFKGALLGKLPGFKQLGWHLVGGYKYLRTGSASPYNEFHIGLDNIGWNVFRLFRVDAVWSNYDKNLGFPFEGNGFGIVVGVKMDL